MIRTYLVIVFSVFTLSACSGSSGAGSDARTPVRLSMKIPAAAQVSALGKPVSEGVQSIAARVINSAGSSVVDPEKRDVQTNDEVVIDFNVPLGQMAFIVEAFSEKNSQGTLLFRGETTENIVDVDDISIININMQVVETISPSNPRVEKTSSVQFSVTGIDPSQITWRLKSVPEGFENVIGRIDPNTGLYTAPVAIPYDVADGRPLGTPVDIQVEAIILNSNQVHDRTAISVVSGDVFTFNPRSQVMPAGTGASLTRSRSSDQRNIAYYQGNAYAVWEQRTDIYFSETISNAGVLGWTEPLILDEIPNRETRRERATIAIGPEGNLYVAYVDCAHCGRLSTLILLMRKVGETDFVRLPLGDSEGFTNFSSNNPTLAVSPDGRTVYVAWSAVAGDGGNDILFQRVNPIDGLKIDEDPRFIASTAADDEQPTIGVAKDGKVYLAWIERDFGTSSPSSNALLAAVSLNGDGQFETPVQVNEVPGNFASFDRRPTLVPGGSGTVHIAWEKDVVGDSIFHVAYDKGVLGTNGLAFGEDELLGRFFIGDDFQSGYRQFHPSITWDGGDGVYIALQAVAFHASDGEDKRAIFLARKSSETDLFSIRAQVNDDLDDLLKTKSKEFPSLTVDETGRAFVLWTDERGGISPRYIWFAATEPFLQP